MKVTIYQINSDRDINNMLFQAYDRLEKFQGSSEVDSKIYDKIYEKDVSCESLEAVYQMFNTDRPSDFKGHSLSVSDVVKVAESEKVADGFYFCDSFGFKKIDFNSDKCQVSDKINNQSAKLKVLLIEPNKYPRIVEIDDTLEAMQELVEGQIEEYMPFEDEVAIICNEEGKIRGLPLNRAIYSEPDNVELPYNEMKALFRQAEKEGRHTIGYIVFTEDSFDKPYTEEERTYVVSSNNKAFIEGMGGYSIYASSLDGSDTCVRLERYMSVEHGGKDGWKIEKCYVKDENSKEMIEVIAGNFFICYAPIESESFKSLPPELSKKYEEKFKYPERFFRDLKGQIVAQPFKPKSKDYER